MLVPSETLTQQRLFELPEFLDLAGFFPTHAFTNLQTMNDADGSTFSNSEKKRKRDDIARLETASTPVRAIVEDSDDDGGDPELKRRKRVLANRRSARESYQRRKKMFSELESSVSILSESNAELADENMKLRDQVMNLQEQLRLSRMPNSATMPCDMGVPGMGPTRLALEQLADHPLPLASAIPQQSQSGILQLQQPNQRQRPSPHEEQQLIQQQSEMDQLLEMLVRGRHL